MKATRKTTPAHDRFWAKVTKGPDCWEWTAGRQGQGYGAFHPTKQTSVLAHRYAYELAYGPIPEGMVIDHLCRNRACVNVVHLEVVTNEENLRRGLGYALQNGMRDHCRNGHLYDEANTYTDPKGGVRCRTCARTRDNQPNRSRTARRANKENAA